MFAPMPSPSAPAASASNEPQLPRAAQPESPEVAAQIDLVLEMTATYDADGFQLPPPVTRRDVHRALVNADGDVSRAVDEVLNLAAIKSLSAQDQQAAAERAYARQKDVRLDLRDLCSGLGLDECSAFMRALQALPESEKDTLLSTNGGFVQQLLLTLDEEENSEDGSSSAGEEQHPLQYLLELYPDYRAEVVEDVLDRHNYDVQAAEEALHNLRAINKVQSYSSVVNANARAAAQEHDLRVNGPKIESLGQFPALETGSLSQKQLKKLKRQQRRQHKPQQEPHQFRPPPKPSPVSEAYPSLSKPSRRSLLKTKPIRNAWDQQSAAHEGVESGITTQLKLERLKNLLPSVNFSIIQTTFFLNGCSSDATEAALRETYNLPLADKPGQATATEAEEAEAAMAAAAAEEAAMATRTQQSQRTNRPKEKWTLVESKRQVNAKREALSDCYCAVLESFRRGHHVLAVDRVRELSKARQEHRDAQRQWAHEFFLAHEEHLKHQRPIDLHGMIVMEALWVAREAIEYCQARRIRCCRLICGVGHHSVNGKPRILTAVRLSLDRRQIAYRELHGIVTVFPGRSSEAA